MGVWWVRRIRWKRRTVDRSGMCVTQGTLRHRRMGVHDARSRTARCGSDKGKSGESRRRKATGLRGAPSWGTTCWPGRRTHTHFENCVRFTTRTFARCWIVGLCASTGLFAGCDDQPTLSPIRRTATAEVPLLRVADDMVKLHEHDVAFIRLSSQQLPSGVRWSSDDPSIVTVDPDGKIHCLRTGSTTITVSSKDYATDVLVTVLPASDADDGSTGLTAF